jgi:hypothetical protein
MCLLILTVTWGGVVLCLSCGSVVRESERARNSPKVTQLISQARNEPRTHYSPFSFDCTVYPMKFTIFTTVWRWFFEMRFAMLPRLALNSEVLVILPPQPLDCWDHSSVLFCQVFKRAAQWHSM